MNTKKPCPGCGEVWPKRHSDQLCYSCRQKLDIEIPMLKTALDQLNSNRDHVAFAKTYHWNRYYRCPSPRRSNSRNNDNSTLLRKALFDLAITITVVDGVQVSKPLYPMGDPKDDFSLYSSLNGTMPTGSAQAFRSLVDLLQPIIDNAFEAGKEKGTALLLSLASGDLSMKDFEDQIKKQG